MLSCSDDAAQNRNSCRRIESIGNCGDPEQYEEMMVYVKWVGESAPTCELLKHIPFYLQNMYTHVRYKNAYTNDITFSEIQRIADAECYEYNRITVLVYFVGNMQPLWESLDYIIANGVKRPFQTNPSVFKIKQSGPDTSTAASSTTVPVMLPKPTVRVMLPKPTVPVVSPEPTVVVVDDGQSVFRPQCSVS